MTVLVQLRRAAACLFLLFLALPSAAAPAAVTARLSEPVSATASLAGQAAQNPAIRRALAGLAAEAAAQGEIRVAVKLLVPFAPESLLAETDRPRQRYEIATAAGALRAALPAARDVVVPEGLPYVVMTLDAQGLARLTALPGLTRIARADQLNWMRDFVELRSDRPWVPLAPAPAVAPGEMSAQSIGGVDTEPGAYPFQVSILEKDIANNFKATYCGGTLVAERFVLTAAHCSDFIGEDVPLKPHMVQVLVGTQRLDGSGTRLDVKQITIHPLWRSDTQFEVHNDYDLAVWELATPVTGIAFATLPRSPPTAAGTVLRAIGFGAWLDDRETEVVRYSDRLQQIDLPFVPTRDGKCTRLGNISPRMICAGGAEGAGVCYGDSGGPLLIDRGAGFSEIVGITSGGLGYVNGDYHCAVGGYPGIFTNLADPEIMSFIRSLMSPREREIRFALTGVTSYESRADAAPSPGDPRGRITWLLNRGKAHLTIIRNSGQGEASVSYATEPVTATPGAGGLLTEVSSGLPAADGGDYVPVSGVVTFRPGQTAVSVDVPLIDDTLREGPETFRVILSGASEGWWTGDRGRAGVTIQDND